MTAEDWAYCKEMLPKVSRTFAACIGLLPPGLEEAVLVAYLLCRIADSIEDSPDLADADKRRLLDAFAGSLSGGEPADLSAAFAAPRNDDERLSAACGRTLACYADLAARRRAAIRPWVEEMCRGMGGFATGTRGDDLRALERLADLDRYCWFVAGTVGHLLTDLFRLEGHRYTAARYRRLKSLATSFGLGLQLTNIVKDVADDAGRGWSFVPADLCRRMGLEPGQLFDGAHRDQARAVLAVLIAKAAKHLEDALEYCLALPRSQYRVRLFCLTPLYFAVRTLRLARHDPQLLDPAHKVKITRGEVLRTILVSRLVAPSNTLCRAYYRRLAAGGP